MRRKNQYKHKSNSDLIRNSSPRKKKNERCLEQPGSLQVIIIYNNVPQVQMF